jgi:uncharacterized protein (DUF433 family)
MKKSKKSTASAQISVQGTAVEQFPLIEKTSAPDNRVNWGATLAQHHQQALALSLNLDLFEKAAHAAGGIVTLDLQHSFLPVIIGNDHRPIPLYELVGSIDGNIDYDDILEDFPTLSFGQIAGAFAFLRNIAQFNVKGLNIEDLEDLLLETSEGFQDAVARSLKDTEATVVRTSE